MRKLRGWIENVVLGCSIFAVSALLGAFIPFGLVIGQIEGPGRRPIYHRLTGLGLIAVSVFPAPFFKYVCHMPWLLSLPIGYASSILLFTLLSWIAGNPLLPGIM